MSGPIHTSTSSTSGVIGIENLEKRFGNVHAVRGVNLNVQRGQIYGFLGPNGAGKTTTIRMLLGLIRPSSGSVQVFGEPLSNRTLGRIGALVETPSAYAHLTGQENLELTRRMLNAPKANVVRSLELVGLKDAAHRTVRGYSLGMKGRLSLAAALLNDPELLILDEPTNGLDPQGIREVRDLVKSLPAQGITVLVSSHLLLEVEQIASHVGIIVAGKMRFSGTLEALRAQSQPSVAVSVNDPTRRSRCWRCADWTPDAPRTASSSTPSSKLPPSTAFCSRRDWKFPGCSPEAIRSRICS
ncbi:MAG: ABC transporter ATP-binding protein [Pleurocapsa sp. SU_196_0]|nr:ABC transporter ATP-binding protein [Pleurocapsa sp. SU_196_0]